MGFAVCFYVVGIFLSIYQLLNHTTNNCLLGINVKSPIIRIWSRTGTHGNQWRKAQLTLSSTQTFTLVFEGIRGNSYRGDIAIDDITLADGKCPPSLHCDFGDGWCHYVNINGDQFDWTRKKGRTSSSGTGPSVDHTTGTHNGIYICS